MAVEQEIRFVLNLSLAENVYLWNSHYVRKSYLINIQQAADKLVVIPADFFNIESSNHFFCSMQDPKYSRLIG